MDLTFQVLMQYCSLQHWTCFYHQSHPQLGVAVALAPSLHSFGVMSPLMSSNILGPYQPGEFIFQCPTCAFSYCSWGSQDMNTEVVCHFSSGPHFVRTLHIYIGVYIYVCVCVCVYTPKGKQIQILVTN